MKIFKAEVNKISLALTSVGIVVLLMLPVSLSANHFRYGTMSWSLVDNDTITLKMENGWTANHSSFRIESQYTAGSGGVWVDGHIGSLKYDLITINWGDGSANQPVDIKITSRDNTTIRSSNCSSGCIDSTISVMGEDNASGFGATPSTPGVTHNYDNGTYIIYWSGSARSPVVNNPANGNVWRNETMVRIGGDYIGNRSPVSAVPPVVRVQDNKTFTYQVSATDPDSDNLTYRWGTLNEFFDAAGDESDGNVAFNKPTGMTLSASGLIEWDIRDNVTCSGCSTNNDAVDNTTNKDWVAVIMVEDRLDNGTAKSYIPIDFFFQVTSADNDAPAFTEFPTGTQTVSIGSTKTFTIKSNDDSGVAPTLSVLNPPSDNESIWSTTSSTSGGIKTFTINFTPDSSDGGSSYVVNIRSADAAGMTKDQSFSIQVSSVANADPTAPILLSPADGDNVTSPVTFRFAGSTDSDGDNVSYTMYVCGRSDFVGCSTGTSVTAGGNFIPPFNQNFHDNLIPWPSPLYAATISQQISQEFSMIPKLFILLGVLGLLSVIISLSVKNITHRRIVYVLFLIIIGTVSCSTSSSNEDELDEENKTDSTDTTAPTVSSVSTTADNQSSVSTTDNIIVTFSEAMDTTYVTTSTSDTNCSGTIWVSSDNFSTGSCVKMSSAPASSNSNKTFTLEPYGYLTVSTTYLTRVTTGVKDTSGNAMSSEYETSSGFTTDNTSTEPTVSSVSTTADNQSLVSITDNITVTFSEAMDTTYVTTNTSDTYCSGTIRVSASSDNFSTGNCVKMSSAPASSNSNKTFTLDPYDNLTRLTTYLTRVTTGVKDTAGNTMGSQYETSSGFTTDNISTARLTVSNSYTSGTTYYWKVVASDPKGGSAQSETWSFTVQ
jgi:hypothetical protein